MSRAVWKPIAQTPAYGRRIFKLASRFERVWRRVQNNMRYNIKTNCLNHRIRNRWFIKLGASRVTINKNLFRSLNFYYKLLRIRGRVRYNVLRPRGSDTVLRLTTRALAFQNFKMGIHRKSKKRSLRRRRKYHAVNKYALLIKFGEFQKTRFYYGFRLKKDRKKIAKLRKDMKKERLKRFRQAKENRRLMRKAVQETKAKNRAKLGKKNVKKAKS